MNHKPVRRPPLFVRIGKILLATHLLPSILVTTMATALAYGSGQRASLWLLVPAILFGQFCIGWTNDYLDRDRDKAAGRLKKPIVSGYVHANTIRNLAMAAIIAALLFSFIYSTVATYAYIVALGSALLYNFRLKNSIFSPLTYVVSFGLLPVYVSLGAAQPFIPNIWIVLAFALWGIGVHIQNVIPDFHYDAKTGVKGAAHYLSTYNATVLTGAALTFSVFALSVSYLAKAQSLIWLIIALFFLVVIVFACLVSFRKLSLAYTASMLMTGVVSLLLMLTGPYLK